MDKKFFLTYNFHTIYLIYLQFFHVRCLSSFNISNVFHRTRRCTEKPHRQVKGGVGDTDKVIYLR